MPGIFVYDIWQFPDNIQTIIIFFAKVQYFSIVFFVYNQYIDDIQKLYTLLLGMCNLK